MRLLDRHIVVSITKVGLVTLSLCTLMLVSVDLFMHLDSYVTGQLPSLTIFRLSLLYIPEALVFALAPSLLFAVTYHLSQMQANNELISLYNSGISYMRIILPILILGICFSLVQFGFNELLAIPSSKSRSVMQNELFGLKSTFDNRNITLSDPMGRFVVHASHYNDERKRISSLTLVVQDEVGSIQSRIDATSATWDEKRLVWTLDDVTIHDLDKLANSVVSRREGSIVIPSFDLEPAFFRNISNDIKTMDLPSARTYLQRIRLLNPKLWYQAATDFAQRILGSLTPLVLVFIACTISYRYKKNVLLFSIITSLFIAVIYYVVQMVTLIVAKQGVIEPLWGMVIPMIVIVSIAIPERLILR
ncbi:LptF/LptG family permease [Sphaerochaeta sp. PS]|uniref:LptF/LptG family permease n=1 Tax=Sphaerochaeta sp. PS TaxID=3076336 RepID=UPI0028A2E588|nr:LptF/LptG family permease [Sphaerochaeta sp. PS]MDT4761474.1 LptF/LptG family permease [Sphaerochaeta sp. PS]